METFWKQIFLQIICIFENRLFEAVFKYAIRLLIQLLVDWEADFFDKE